jgi:hypothetical protein
MAFFFMEPPVMEPPVIEPPVDVPMEPPIEPPELIGAGEDMVEPLPEDIGMGEDMVVCAKAGAMHIAERAAPASAAV